jgi:hypothetical protein
VPSTAATASEAVLASPRTPTQSRSLPCAERNVMLQLDYALLCDYVRGEGGVAHVIAAGIDTVYRPEVPTVANFGLLARFTFTDEDLGEEHRLELQLADQEGQQVAQITGTPPLQPVPGLPEGWPYGGIITLNARDQMRRRGITDENVEQALRRPVGNRPGEPGTIWIRGTTGGRILEVCVTLADKSYVVTVAWK